MADMEDAPLPKLFAGDGAGASAAACVTASAEAVAGFSLGGRYYDELMACTDGLQKLQTIVWVGNSGTGKSTGINGALAAHPPAPGPYASHVLAGIAERGSPEEVVISDAAENDPYRVIVEPLLRCELRAGLDVELFFGHDNAWVSARVLEVRESESGVQARVDTYDDDGTLADDADAADFLPVVLDKPTGAAHEHFLRHIRTPRHVAPPQVDVQGPVPVPVEEQRFYLVPEGTTGHTTEVPEQAVRGSGDRCAVTEYYASAASVVGAVAELREYVAGTPLPAQDEEGGADLSFLFEESDAAAAGPATASAAPPATDRRRIAFRASNSCKLACAVLGLPRSFNLELLRPADVPDALPAHIAELLGRKRVFTPGVRPADDEDGMLERHLAALRGALAERTRCVWDETALDERGWPSVRAGNPHAGLIVRVVIDVPGHGAVAAGRVLLDTRGVEAGDKASTAAIATAASLAAAAAIVLVVDPREGQQEGLMAAAEDSGALRAFAHAALWKPTAARPTPPPHVRVAVLILGDKAWSYDSAEAALRPGGGAAAEGEGALVRQRAREGVATAAIRTKLRTKLAAMLREKGASDATAVMLSDEAIAKVVTVVLYASYALGGRTVPPPRCTADAALLRDTCGLTKLARFIEGDAAAAADALTAALQPPIACMERYVGELETLLSLHSARPGTVALLRQAAHTIAPQAAAVWGDSAAPAAAAAADIDVQEWRKNFIAALRGQLADMLASLVEQCTAIQFGCQLAELAGITDPAVGRLPPSQFAGAMKADTSFLHKIVKALLQQGSYEGRELHELMCARLFKWEVYGEPAFPTLLLLNWLTAVVAGGEAPLGDDFPLAQLFVGVVNGVYDRADAAARDADAAPAVREKLRTVLAAGRERLRADLERVLRARFGALNATLFWARPSLASHITARDLACEIIGICHRGKQAMFCTKSDHKSDNNLGKTERKVGHVAQLAKQAFVETAIADLERCVDDVLRDFGALVAEHCARLSTGGGLTELTSRQLQFALKAHTAACAHLAQLRRMAGAAAGGGAGTAAALPPAAMLPFPILLLQVPKLAEHFTKESANLDSAITNIHDSSEVLWNSVCKAAEVVAVEAQSLSATRQLKLFESWAHDSNTERRKAGRARLAALSKNALRTLALAFFGEKGSLLPGTPLLRFLEEAAAPPVPCEVGGWSEEEMRAVLECCLEDAAAAAFADVGSCAAQCAAWLPRIWAAYKAHCANQLADSAAEAHREARKAGVALTLKPRAERTEPWHWVGAQVAKSFADPKGRGFKLYSGWADSVVEVKGVKHVHVTYEDSDHEDMTLAALAKVVVATPADSGASGSADDGPIEADHTWRERSLASVFTLISVLQRGTGTGPQALRLLHERYALSDLKAEEGWLVIPNVLTKRGIVTEFRYYGELSATDGKPIGLPDGSESVLKLFKAGTPATRTFISRPAVHAFRGTGAILPPLRSGGGSRHCRLPLATIRDMMTPREVTLDGVPVPADAVAEHRSAHKLGTWLWRIKTRKGGKSSGSTDTHYDAPSCGGAKRATMRALTDVEDWFETQGAGASGATTVQAAKAPAAAKRGAAAVAPLPEREAHKRQCATSRRYEEDSD